MAPAAADNYSHCYGGGGSGDDDQAQTVCVMDASGRLGSALVHKLLLRGYAVHAAVQKLGKSQQSLELSWGNHKNLRIFQTDLFDYHTIMEALKGCTALFYSFEPPSDHPNYDELMADVEVMAAHNALEACAQTPTVHKVVFTSSATAVLWKEDRSSSSLLINESSWSNINLCRKFKLWHALSKTLAEKTAWALAMDRDINMVTVNGGLLLSADLTIANPYLKGAAEMYDDGVLVAVDLKHVVDAHVCVFEDASSFGRYLCFNHVVNSHDEVSKLARVLLSPSGQFSLPPPGMVEKGVQQRISNKKLHEHMVGFDTGLRID